VLRLAEVGGGVSCNSLLDVCAKTGDVLEINPVRTVGSNLLEECDFLSGIGAVPSGNRRMAPMPWEGIVFLRNTHRGQISCFLVLQRYLAHKKQRPPRTLE
jgi:hypothetical protein